MKLISQFFFGLLLISFCCTASNRAGAQDATTDIADAKLINQATIAILKASKVFVQQASTRGGYVYRVSVDGKLKFGEGAATPTEIWVQPPGTPTVGMALLRAYQATGDKRLFDQATAAAEALMFGQLESGGWTNRVDFDAQGKHTGRYRDGKGNAKGRNYSSLDDDQSQSTIRFLIELDKAYDGKHEKIHESVNYALAALLNAQFANGGFPQVWEHPVANFPVIKASFPEYEWRTEGRIKDYWNYETLNDGLPGTVTSTLWLAYEAYHDERYKDAMLRFGDFLILSQLPEPQPAWAQQYNHSLVPIWARKFEPPAVVGRESEDAIQTLMFITEKTGEQRFLKPIPAAIAWLKRSRLPDGKLARFYEIHTNKPLYFVAKGEVYTLTYDDSELPTHYGFKTDSNIDRIESRYQILAKGEDKGPSPESLDRGQIRVPQLSLKTLRGNAARILAEMDDQGRWVTDKTGTSVVDVAHRPSNELFFDSALFSKNISSLAEYILVSQGKWFP